MSETIISLISVGSMFGGALLGIWLHGRLPRHHLDANTQEVVKLGAGMLATITALVLGLLVSSTKGTFDTINEGIKQGCAKVIQLDRVLAQYGPEAQGVRDHLKQSVVAAVEAGRRQQGAEAAGPTRPGSRLEAVQAQLCALTPHTDSQRQWLADAHQLTVDMAQQRWLLVEESQNEIPPVLLGILVIWLGTLFVSFGLFAPRNGTVLTVLFVSACSMGMALFLILEMNHPTQGLIRVSKTPILNLLQQLGQ